MVAQRYAREYPRDDEGKPPDCGRAAVAVIGFDGVVLARVSWRTESPERARVLVEGDVDHDTAPLLRAEVLEALAHRPVVCCDLRLASFLGSVGVHTLAKVHVAAAESGRTMVLAGVSGIVEQVLRATGMLDVLAVEP